MSDKPVSYDTMKRELTERQPQWSGVLPLDQGPGQAARLTPAETKEKRA